MDRKESLLEQIKELLNTGSKELNAEEYRDFCDSVASECEERICALDDDEEEEEEEEEAVEEEDD